MIKISLLTVLFIHNDTANSQHGVTPTRILYLLQTEKL